MKEVKIYTIVSDQLSPPITYKWIKELLSDQE